MGTDEHDLGGLGAYVLGAADEPDRRAVEEHLAGCPQCRVERIELERTVAALGVVPPEAFLSGPPHDGDLLLQRTLREVRRESARRALNRRSLFTTAAALIVIAALVGGVLIGRAQDRAPSVAQPAQTSPAQPLPAPPPSGTVVASRTDPATGARITVRVVPAAGWVRVNAAVTGIPEGQRCRLWVVATDGTRQLAGSWLVSAAGAREGTNLDGSALVAPADVAAVEIDDVSGRVFVSVPL